VSASSIERTMGFAGNLSAVFPNVVDVLDADFALREYSEVLGNNPKLLKPTEEVEQARAAQAEQAQQQQAMEQAGSMAQGAKVLSETDSQSPNALTDLLGAGTI
jgi:hypothetical protein